MGSVSTQNRKEFVMFSITFALERSRTGHAGRMVMYFCLREYVRETQALNRLMSSELLITIYHHRVFTYRNIFRILHHS